MTSFSLVSPAAIYESIQTWVHGFYIGRLEGVSKLLLL